MDLFNFYNINTLLLKWQLGNHYFEVDYFIFFHRPDTLPLYSIFQGQAIKYKRQYSDDSMNGVSQI